jgi:uncharacterized protein YbjT (DUF2867 family)
MSAQSATVFGGTGFLGRRIVRHLHEAGFIVRIASRHPERGLSMFPAADSRIEPVYGDIKENASVAAAVSGVFAVVNAVSLYVERGADTFESVHVGAAQRVATLARQGGAKKFLHISGIGANKQSASPYIRSRGQGEEAVLTEYPSATLFRPAVMFGPGDALLTPLLRMLRQFPAFPMFGGGDTRLQPAYVEDVGKASARVLQAPDLHRVYELGGPRIYNYRTLLGSTSTAPFVSPVSEPIVEV